MFSKKNIISLLSLAIIALALPLAVNLAKHQQILHSKAGTDPITYLNSDGSTITPDANGNLVTHSLAVKVALNAPAPSVAPSVAPTLVPVSESGTAFEQLMVLSDYKQVLTRACPADASGTRGVNFGPNFDNSTCSGWSFAYNIANDTSLPQSFRDNGVISWDEYFWTNAQGQKGFQQTMINKDGKQTVTRTCSANNPSNRGVDFSNCSGWSTAYNIGNDTTFPAQFQGHGAVSWDEYFFTTAQGDTHFEQVMILDDYKQLLARECVADPAGNRGVNFGSCTGWSFAYNIANDTTLSQSFRDNGAVSLHEYFWKNAQGQKAFQQIMINKDGKQTVSRTCNADNPVNRGVDFNSCSGWSTAYNIGNDPTFPPQFKGSGAVSWNEYYY